MKNKEYYWRNIIGDGKKPNKFFVFHYDEKFKLIENGDCCDYVSLNPDIEETKNSFLGEFKTIEDAVECVNNKAFYPHVVIEDRLVGQIFEQMCIVCQCCGYEEYETYDDRKLLKLWK